MDQYASDSKMLTHESLINLGKTIAMDEITDRIKKEETKKIEKKKKKDTLESMESSK